VNGYGWSRFLTSLRAIGIYRNAAEFDAWQNFASAADREHLEQTDEALRGSLNFAVVVAWPLNAASPPAIFSTAGQRDAVAERSARLARRRSSRRRAQRQSD
jgi:hypothetical protein